jgi:hypothetical protein
LLEPKADSPVRRHPMCSPSNCPCYADERRIARPAQKGVSASRKILHAVAGIPE